MNFEFLLEPESVLTHDKLQESFRLVVPFDGDLRYGEGIGYASERSDDSDLAALGHGGETRNYISSFKCDRASQSGIIVLTSDKTKAYKPLVREGLKILKPQSLCANSDGSHITHRTTTANKEKDLYCHF